MRGSYPWTYHLGERGQVILRDSQVVDTGWRYRPHVVHEFGHVLHDLQLNAWLLAYRRQPGVGFLAWEGERTIEPPPTTREERAEPRWLPLAAGRSTACTTIATARSGQTRSSSSTAASGRCRTRY
jgi:hypothetical protein